MSWIFGLAGKRFGMVLFKKVGKWFGMMISRTRMDCTRGERAGRILLPFLKPKKDMGGNRISEGNMPALKMGRKTNAKQKEW